MRPNIEPVNDQKTKYFKIINAERIHNNFKYEIGLNEDILPFNKHGSCCPGGLYFTDHENIHTFYEYGIYLCPVELPLNDPEFQMVADGNKFRANKIILEGFYSLFDKNTYDIFNLDVPDLKDLVIIKMFLLIPGLI